MIGKGGITLYHMVSVSYGHRMGMVWYEWAAKECISMSDNQSLGSGMVCYHMLYCGYGIE